MEPHTARTLATLRETLRLTEETRALALERGNLALVATEDEMIVRLRERIVRIVTAARRRMARAEGPPADDPADEPGPG